VKTEHLTSIVNWNIYFLEKKNTNIAASEYTICKHNPVRVSGLFERYKCKYFLRDMLLCP